VAELLRQHLAHLENPALVPTPAPVLVPKKVESVVDAESHLPSPSRLEEKGTGGRGKTRRRWALAAAILLVLVGGLTLTEAAGVTNLRATVIGILQPSSPITDANNNGGKPDSGKAATPLDFPVGEVRTHVWPRRKAAYAVFSPDGRYYAATGVSGEESLGVPETLRVWELASGKLVVEVKGNLWAAFTPDSKCLLASGPDRRIHVWDLTTKQKIAQFGEDQNWMPPYSLSADGQQLLIGNSDWFVRLYDVAQGKEIAALKSEAKLCTPYFCPDGKHAITLDLGGTIRLWNLEKQQ
jgi:WD40 repeat protein